MCQSWQTHSCCCWLQPLLNDGQARLLVQINCQSGPPKHCKTLLSTNDPPREQDSSRDQPGLFVARRLQKKFFSLFLYSSSPPWSFRHVYESWRVQRSNISLHFDYRFLGGSGWRVLGWEGHSMKGHQSYLLENRTPRAGQEFVASLEEEDGWKSLVDHLVGALSWRVVASGKSPLFSSKYCVVVFAWVGKKKDRENY